MSKIGLQFLKSLPGDNETLRDGLPQIAVIGRSNVGKSSLINAIAGQKSLARISPTPGHTKTLNIYKQAQNKFYLVDLPGYGYAKTSKTQRQQLAKLINWYFFDSGITQKFIILIIDAKVGLTELDKEMLTDLSLAGKQVLVVANKIDKLKQGELQKQIQVLKNAVTPYNVLPFSALNKTGVGELNQRLQEGL